MNLRTLFVSAALTAALAGCNINSIIYRADVHQGNLVTREMIEQLRVGMTPGQVQFILGIPLITDQFHQRRWDYTYYVNPRRGVVETRRVTLLFDQESRLEKITYDPLPTEQQADEMIFGKKVDYKSQQEKPSAETSSAGAAEPAPAADAPAPVLPAGALEPQSVLLPPAPEAPSIDSNAKPEEKP